MLKYLFIRFSPISPKYELWLFIVFILPSTSFPLGDSAAKGLAKPPPCTNNTPLTAKDLSHVGIFRSTPFVLQGSFIIYRFGARPRNANAAPNAPIKLNIALPRLQCTSDLKQQPVPNATDELSKPTELLVYPGASACAIETPTPSGIPHPIQIGTQAQSNAKNVRQLAFQSNRMPKIRIGIPPQLLFKKGAPILFYCPTPFTVRSRRDAGTLSPN